MATRSRLISQLRLGFSKLVIISFFIYLASFSLSGAAIEISGVCLAFFTLITALLDRACSNRKIEWHTLGVEMPLVLFVVILSAGLLFNGTAEGITHGSKDAGLLILRLGLVLFLATLALQIVKNLNGLMITLTVFAVLAAIYGIWQHFAGLDLVRHQALTLVEEGARHFKSQGLFRSPVTFAHALMLVAPLPWAAFLLFKKSSIWKKLFALSVFLILACAIYFTYARGAWIALAVMLPITAVFISRKAFLYVIVFLGLGFVSINKIHPEFKSKFIQSFAESAQVSEEKRILWEINLAMFKDHPWIGVGYKQNESLAATYAAKLNLPLPEGSGHSHSTYIEFLSTTGIIGFFAYMLFVLAFVLMTARLLTSIPSTHFWHRVLVLAALGAQVSFHVGGLTHRNFGDDIVLHQFLFWLALIAYMSQRYYAHIVPDDRSI